MTFFFSSRRRHTRYWRDWSSDVCSSDLSKEVDSNSPAPGGGSVAALASNIGVSLSRMMANLSFGKKKYESLSEDIRLEFTEKFNNLGDIREELIELVDKDTEAFEEYMKALKLRSEEHTSELQSRQYLV